MRAVLQVSNLGQNLDLQKVTVVQQKALPVILSGKDALIRSQTGSGKTLTYALPIVEALQAVRPKISRADGVRAIVVVPTRELALQTYEWFVKLVKVSACVQAFLKECACPDFLSTCHYWLMWLR